MVLPVDRPTAIADAAPVSYWLDDPTAPPSAPPLVGRTAADLTVVGGGYTGLWTALLSKEAEPDRDVLVLESDRCGWAASGRNGGFCSASLTHGLSNGSERFPDEITTLERLGKENLDEIESKAVQLPVDCGFERTGDLTGRHRAVPGRVPPRRRGSGSALRRQPHLPRPGPGTS